MKDKRPALVSYIVDLNFLFILLSIASFFPRVLNRFGIITPTPTISNVIYRISVIIILLLISYGLLRLKRWGYWLMISYNVISLIAPIILLLTKQSVNYINYVGAIFGLSLILSARRYFFKDNKSLNTHPRSNN
jgi:hypothetical protein